MPSLSAFCLFEEKREAVMAIEAEALPLMA
jgi:hypothetical protein